MRTEAEVEIEGRALVLSNLGKVLYPAVGFTKADVIDYYVRIAPLILPHLRGRALTLKRYPEGVEGVYFYEKRCPQHRPAWVRTALVRSLRKGNPVDYCLADDLPSLVWAANLADLELHTGLALARVPERPTVVAFDLDPGAPANIVTCGRVALHLRTMMSSLGLRAYPKTSGSKGIQVYVPLNTPGVTFDRTKAFARTVAEVLDRDHPQLVVSRMAKVLRGGRVFVDWSQNDFHKTTVTVYSLRARERPTVSTPVSWDEVERLVRAGRPERLTFDAGDVLARVRRYGDLFSEVLSVRQTLPRGA